MVTRRSTIYSKRLQALEEIQSIPKASNRGSTILDFSSTCKGEASDTVYS